MYSRETVITSHVICAIVIPVFAVLADEISLLSGGHGQETFSFDATVPETQELLEEPVFHKLQKQVCVDLHIKFHIIPRDFLASGTLSLTHLMHYEASEQCPTLK